MRRALLLVDLQRDFFPGGALGVKDADPLVPVVNELIRRFRGRDLPIILTRDWHTPSHVSFKERGGPWPPHCVAGTDGASFHPALDVPPDARVVSKAAAADRDAYSGFQGTDLALQLRQQDVTDLVVAGLATEYCVKNSVLDALKEGFSVTVVEEGIRAVNVDPDDGRAAIEEMKRSGARFSTLSDILSEKGDCAGT
jgi:nicotinamidase/pyrazinamidase